MVDLSIKPKEGIGTVSFGSSMQEVKKLLGKAQEEERADEGPGLKTTVWHYWEKGFSIFFNAEYHNVFSCIEIDNKEAVLWGKKIFELSEEEIISLFKEKGIIEFEKEELEGMEYRLSFDDLLMDFYFEYGKLSSINYGIFIDGEKVLILPN